MTGTEALLALAADLIEAQEQRIKELEAYTKSLETSRGELVETQAEKITEQRKRIKELEAALCEEVEARSKWYCEADRLKEELAALHKRIDDAPVVAWANKDRGLISAWEKAHYTEMKALGSPGGERWLKGEDAERHTIPLISKEDLK